MMRPVVFKSYLGRGLLVSLVINMLLFCSLPGLIVKKPCKSDLESLNVVNFTRIRQERPDLSEEKKPPEKEPEEKPEKIHRVRHQNPKKVCKKELTLNMPAMDLDIDQRISGGIPVVSPAQEQMGQEVSAAPMPDFNAVMDQGEVDTVPVPTFKRPPRYPYRAKRMGLEGEVKVSFVVGKDGSVSDIRILSASVPGIFDESVINAISTWTYSPGELMNRKVVTRVTTSVKFKLEG